jgi:D-amino peptidase
MKVYISVDIEGCAGITHWDEAEKNHADWAEFREQMTREAVAAIEGAQIAGATEILVKDAHSSGRNLITSMLPENVRVIRAWTGHPLCMVQDLDESFDAVMMIGYHSEAGSEANSLAHTLSHDASLIRINGEPASEFTIHALASSMLGVPTVFVSGDKGLMDHVEATNPNIGRCAVKEGRGQCTISMTPAAAVKAIREGAATALRGELSASLLQVPEHISVEITYSNPNLASRHCWYPGMTHIGNRTVRFETDNYFDVLRMLNYVT